LLVGTSTISSDEIVYIHSEIIIVCREKWMEALCRSKRSCYLQEMTSWYAYTHRSYKSYVLYPRKATLLKLVSTSMTDIFHWGLL